MANPARKPQASLEHHDETLEILRRLEPVLTRIMSDIGTLKADQDTLKITVARLDEHQRKQGEDIAEIKGVLKSVPMREDVVRVDARLGELSTRVPTLWTIAALIFAIFGASLVLIKLASGH